MTAGKEFYTPTAEEMMPQTRLGSMNNVNAPSWQRPPPTYTQQPSAFPKSSTSEAPTFGAHKSVNGGGSDGGDDVAGFKTKKRTGRNWC